MRHLEEACFFAIHQQTTMRFEITLKNASIEIVMDRISKSHFHRSYEGTTKGTVAFVRPPKGAIERAMETAKPAIVVFPRFDPESQTVISSLEKSDAFRALVGNTPNYMTLLETGFETLATLVETCGLYTLSYRNIDEAISLIESIDLGARGLGN